MPYNKSLLIMIRNIKDSLNITNNKSNLDDRNRLRISPFLMKSPIQKSKSNSDFLNVQPILMPNNLPACSSENKTRSMVNVSETSSNFDQSCQIG